MARFSVRRSLCPITVVLVALASMGSAANAQIEPPPGPVAPTMKRLDQIEPRRCVNSLPGSATAVHVISEPGNYVLTRDVVGQDRKSGIEITCDGHVSLDLNGFSLLGVEGSLHGIHVREPGSGLPTGRRSFAVPHVLESSGRISSWGGDGLHVVLVDECDVSGLSITDCGGMACRVRTHESAMASIRNIKAIACGGGGVHVDVTASSGAGGGAGRVRCWDLSCVSCGGDAMHIRCSSSSRCDVSVERCTASSCSGHGVCLDATFGGGGGGGGAGKASFSDLSFSSCTGDGVRCVCSPDWRASSSLRRCVVADCDGDGFHMLDVVVDFEDIFCSRCGGNGLHVEGSSSPAASVRGTNFTFDTTVFATYIRNVSSVSLSNGRCSSCVEDGIRCESVARCYIGTCDASACGGSGFSLVDCPDVSSHGLRASACLVSGISHSFSNAPDLHTAAHEAAHVVQCGRGLSIECPSSMTLELSCVSSSFSSNMGPGVSVSCPAACPVRCSFDRCVSSSNGGSGIELVCHPDSSVQCSCTHLRCVHNGGGGVVVVSTDPALTISSGSLHLDSTVCSSNGGAGCRCECPLHAHRCVMSENGSSGVDVRVASSFDSAGEMTDCTLHRNALHGARCGPGRFSPGRCDASDNGGDGLRCESGCLIVDSCICNRNGGDGLWVQGTLTVSGGAMRRNGGGGVRCADGTCAMSDCVLELNGANPGVTGGGAIFVSCSSVSLLRCSSNNNTGPGLFCSSSSGVSCAWSSLDCVSSGNTEDGMRLNHCFGAQVVRCVLSNNGQWGLHCPQGFSSGKIDACSCTGNGGGILVLGQNNLVISNTCSSGPLGSISAAQGNAVGRIVDQASLGTGACDGRSNLVH